MNLKEREIHRLKDFLFVCLVLINAVYYNCIAESKANNKLSRLKVAPELLG